MGTRLIARGLDLAHDDPALWNLSHPGAVADIHARDLAAGSDAILSNTFGANRVWLSRLGRAADVAMINHHGVRLAREVAGPDRFVIGSIGPTAADSPDAAREQAGLLAEAGVDALILETFIADQALRALQTLVGTTSLPLLVSLVQWPTDSALTALRLTDLGAEVLGANCQNGPEPALQTAALLRSVTPLPLLFKPNAGLPGAETRDADSFARMVAPLLSLGTRLIGGCCGTTEAHVAALRAACYDGTLAGNPPVGATNPARSQEPSSP
jgi:methionine synthase I (cobalamin-dependent)